MLSIPVTYEHRSQHRPTVKRVMVGGPLPLYMSHVEHKRDRKVNTQHASKLRALTLRYTRVYRPLRLTRVYMPLRLTRVVYVLHLWYTRVVYVLPLGYTRVVYTSQVG